MTDVQMPVCGALPGRCGHGTGRVASENNPWLQAGKSQQLEKVALLPFLTRPLFPFFSYFFLLFSLSFLKKKYYILFKIPKG